MGEHPVWIKAVSLSASDKGQQPFPAIFNSEKGAAISAQDLVGSFFRGRFVVMQLYQCD